MSVYPQNALVSRQVASKGIASLGVVRGPDFDAATIAFAAASGATDLAPIDAFVRGLKSAGLWSFIRSWPMLPGQNSASGATIYGLGGLSSENGTLVNAPTRQATGIEFLIASGQYMSVPIAGFTGSYAVGGVFTPLTTGAPNSCFIGVNGTLTADSIQINDASGGVLAGAHRVVAGSTNISPPNQAFVNGTPFFVVQGWDLATVYRSKDGAAVSAATAAFGGAISPLRVNARGDSNTPGANKRSAFAFYMAGNGGSPAQYDTLRNLYKTTLGTPLGLP